MKKYYALLIGAVFFTFTACEKDPAAAAAQLGQAAVTEVTSTTAVVSCPTIFTQEELSAGEVLFVYAVIEDGSLGQEIGFIPDWSLADGVLSGRLENLKPLTTYVVSVVVSANKVARSKGVGFVTANADDPNGPLFGTPAYSAVTQTTATISCTFDYTGDKTISEAYFVYTSSVGDEQRAVVATTTGVKSAQLASLSVSTEYTFRLWVVIDGKSYSSQEGAFTTLNAGEIVPTFGTPTFSAVTQTTATVSCTFDYPGDKRVEEVYFVYSSTTGGEQRAAMTTTAGVKSAQLTGLSAETVYTFGLYAMIDGKSYSGSQAVFTTLPQGGNPGLTRYAGWAELPSEAEKPGDYIYAYHYRADANKIRNYSVCYSARLRCAIWTAMPFHKCYIGSTKRTNAWQYDPKIQPYSLQPNLQSSYRPSGSYSRGHMVASNERTISPQTNAQTFYYTNMSPQIQNGFNGGFWGTLEGLCDKVICSDTLYVVTGSYFQNENTTCEDRDGKKIVVPTHFYKVLIRSKSGNTGKPLWELPADQIQCAGWWLEHKVYSGATLKDYIKSVADIEQITGQKFFINVPNAPKETFKSSDWGL